MKFIVDKINLFLINRIDKYNQKLNFYFDIFEPQACTPHNYRIFLSIL